MPTIAKAGRLTGAPGNSDVTSAAKAAPSVAPMNSDGEKMPPEEPEPRLIEVASSLATASTSRRRRRELAVQGGLDRRVADALDEVMPVRQPEARTSATPTMQHAQSVAQIAAADLIEDIFQPVQGAHEARRGDAGDGAEQRVEHQGQHAARRVGQGGEVDRDAEGRLRRRRRGGR